MHKEEIDTNIYNIELGVIADPDVKVATGDAVFCKHCGAVFSHISKINRDTN